MAECACVITTHLILPFLFSLQLRKLGLCRPLAGLFIL